MATWANQNESSAPTWAVTSESGGKRDAKGEGMGLLLTLTYAGLIATDTVEWSNTNESSAPVWANTNES